MHISDTLAEALTLHTEAQLQRLLVPSFYQIWPALFLQFCLHSFLITSTFSLLIDCRHTSCGAILHCALYRNSSVCMSVNHIQCNLMFLSIPNLLSFFALSDIVSS